MLDTIAKNLNLKVPIVQLSKYTGKNYNWFYHENYNWLYHEKHILKSYSML